MSWFFPLELEMLLLFDGPGAIGKSAHAGIPFLCNFRRDSRLQGKIHFWPFDGFEIPKDKPVVVETHTSMFMGPCLCGDRSLYEQEAYSAAKWLQELDRTDSLRQHLNPVLTAEQIKLAAREGWILGVIPKTNQRKV